MNFQLMSMDGNGSLFRFSCVGGWQRCSWVNQTGWNSLAAARTYIRTHLIQDVPDSRDSYIAEVDKRGMIHKTYPVIHGETPKGGSSPSPVS